MTCFDLSSKAVAAIIESAVGRPLWRVLSLAAVMAMGTVRSTTLNVDFRMESIRRSAASAPTFWHSNLYTYWITIVGTMAF